MVRLLGRKPGQRAAPRGGSPEVAPADPVESVPGEGSSEESHPPHDPMDVEQGDGQAGENGEGREETGNPETLIPLLGLLELSTVITSSILPKTTIHIVLQAAPPSKFGPLYACQPALQLYSDTVQILC